MKAVSNPRQQQLLDGLIVRARVEQQRPHQPLKHFCEGVARPHPSIHARVADAAAATAAPVTAVCRAAAVDTGQAVSTAASRQR